MARNKAFQFLCMAATGLAILILAVLLLSVLTQGVGGLNLGNPLKAATKPTIDTNHGFS